MQLVSIYQRAKQTKQTKQASEASADKAAINWGQIASQIQSRSWKQCRERWCCHLDPNLVRTAFSSREDEALLDLQAKLGNKWADIASNLPGRSENCVKTRFRSLEKKKMRGWGKQAKMKIKLEEQKYLWFLFVIFICDVRLFSKGEAYKIRNRKRKQIIIKPIEGIQEEEEEAAEEATETKAEEAEAEEAEKAEEEAEAEEEIHPLDVYLSSSSSELFSFSMRGFSRDF